MTKQRKKVTRKKGPVNSTKIKVDGIQFQSKLEGFCYRELKKAGLFEKYEEEIFQILEPFNFPCVSYERQVNSKGIFKNRGQKKMIGIRYTPDFTGEDYIIEVKGRPNDSFSIRWKLFKKHLADIGCVRTVFKPQSQKEILEMIEVINAQRAEKNRSR